jgi:hypothetical protein
MGHFLAEHAVDGGIIGAVCAALAGVYYSLTGGRGG